MNPSPGSVQANLGQTGIPRLHERSTEEDFADRSVEVSGLIWVRLAERADLFDDYLVIADGRHFELFVLVDVVRLDVGFDSASEIAFS